MRELKIVNSRKKVMITREAWFSAIKELVEVAANEETQENIWVTGKKG